MITRFTLVSLFFLCGMLVKVNAQKATVADTVGLLRELETAETTQETLIVLHDLVDAYWGNNWSQVSIYLKRIESISKREKLPAELGYVRLQEANLLRFQSKIDSARQLYTEAHRLFLAGDSIASALFAYARIALTYHMQGDYLTAEQKYREVQQQLPAEGFLDLRAKLYNDLGSLYHYQGLADSANYYYGRSVACFGQLKDTFNLLAPLFNQAMLNEESNLDKAYEIYKFIADYHRRKSNYVGLSHILGALADTEYRRQDLVKSYNHAEEGYKLSQQLGDNQSSIYYLELLSNLSRANEDYAQALRFQQEGEQLARAHELADPLIFIIQERGIIYQEKGEPHNALLAFEEALAEVRKLKGDSRLLPDILVHVGQLKYETGQQEAGEHALLEARQLVIDTKEGYFNLISADRHLAQIYFDRGDIQRAAIFVKEAVEYAPGVEDVILQTSIYELAAKVYKAQQKHELALSHFEQYVILNDSVRNIDNVRELTRKQKTFEFEQEKQLLVLAQAKEAAVLQAESQRNLAVAGVVGLLALVLGGFFYQSRRQNQQIEQQKDQLTQLNQTKDRLFAIIGHDLRKPAIAFRGITQKINYLLGKQDYDRLAALGQTIEKDATALGQLTDNLLNWALLQKDVLTYQPVAVPLEAIAEEVSDTFRGRLADKELELQFDIPEGAEVYADRSSLRTIIRNLIDNAIKYTPAGGRITLAAATEDGQMCIRITDTGVGIPEDQLRDIFVLQKDKSQAGTQGEKGTGLGLHLVQELTKLNQGMIEVHSRLAEGTVFELRLPVG